MSENQNKKILIADSGATKTRWVEVEGEKQTAFETIGLHPSFIDKAGIQSSLGNSPLSRISGTTDELYFYGAGCGNEKGRDLMKESLHDFFRKARIQVETDLLGACRGLFEKGQGIAVILGTGSNSAFYQQEKIIAQQPSLGYILGDEGSGAYLGKSLVKAYLNSELPKELENAFTEKYQLNRGLIINAVYSQPFPNRFLASFCPFLSENKEHPFINDLILNGLDDFFKMNLLKYENRQQIKFRFCGSIAFYFSEFLEKLCFKYKMDCDRIEKSPMEGLVEYHGNKKHQ